MSTSLFSTLDWLVFGAYFGLIIFMSWYFSRRKITSTNDFFLGGNTMPGWVVAVSVLATSQSAATFLGGPDSAYRGNLTYLSLNVGTLIAVLYVSYALIPRFYANKVTTVYELLEVRFGEKAKKAAGSMYLFGRLFASGSRLYMGAIAVSMILFMDVQWNSVLISLIILSVVGLAYTYMGGIRSIIWTDLIQLIVYVGAAIAVMIYLLWAIPADMGQIIDALKNPGDGQASKLTFFDWNFDTSPAGAFTMPAILTGVVLLNIASYGLDQDMTQRVLTCKTSREGAWALINSILISLPVLVVFMSIGLLLYIFYQRPDLMNVEGKEIVQEFKGEKVTVFMYYILNEMPAGLRGLATVGVIAAALSTINSGLNSMSSVAVQDLYRPFMEKQGKKYDEMHYVRAGRVGMAIIAVALTLIGFLSYFWQQSTDMPLLNFALSVMAFSYAGLLAVYFTALYTKRGNATSVILALLTGFAVVFLLQPYIWDHSIAKIIPSLAKEYLAFPYQLIVGTLIAFLVAVSGNPNKAQS